MLSRSSRASSPAAAGFKDGVSEIGCCVTGKISEALQDWDQLGKLGNLSRFLSRKSSSSGNTGSCLRHSDACVRPELAQLQEEGVQVGLLLLRDAHKADLLKQSSFFRVNVRQISYGRNNILGSDLGKLSHKFDCLFGLSFQLRGEDFAVGRGMDEARERGLLAIWVSCR